MPEKVMGLGQQKSLKSVIENAVDEFLKYEGAPRKITGRTTRVEFIAERDELEGEFERFHVRARVDKKKKAKLEKVVEELKGSRSSKCRRRARRTTKARGWPWSICLK